jgi:hypothetical protein
MLDHTTGGSSRATTGWLVLTLASAGVGLGLTLTSPEMPGSEPMTFEDAVDAAAMLGFGFLGVALVRRRMAEGLGLALMLLAAVSAANYLLDGIAHAIANGNADPPAAAQVLNLLAQGAFIVTFFVFFAAPMLLFPTGRLPSPRWRWPAGMVAIGCAISVLAVLLAPGPVDDDNPAWGDNPLGLSALPGLADSGELIGGVLLLLGLVTGVAAFAVRCVRYRGARRRQMAWFSLAIVVPVAGLLTEFGDAVAIQVASALVIFGSVFVGIGWPLLGPLGRQAESESRDLFETPPAAVPGVTRT